MSIDGDIGSLYACYWLCLDPTELLYHLLDGPQKGRKWTFRDPGFNGFMFMLHPSNKPPWLVRQCIPEYTF